jgi:elongation factor Ts
MPEITAQLVKDLRDKTGAGMMDCKQALAESGGDLDKAVDILRKKGLKSVSKRSEKVAAEGTVLSYIHPGARVGVLLELNCETDFVARSDDFQNLAKDIAMHIAWSAPRFLSRESVPPEVVAAEREIHRAQLQPGQEKVADKILAGKMEKFYQENCLLEQADARDSSGKKTVQDIINDVSAKVGERVVLRRFVRYEVGEGIAKTAVDYAAEVAAAAAAAG